MPYVFQDFETRSLLDLTVTGTMRYVLDTSTRALLWSWAIDDDPLKLWCPDLSDELHPEVWAYVKGRMAAIGACPAEVVAALQKPDTYVVGWNEGFDAKVWRQVVVPDHDWPDIRIEQTLDAMSQAQASNLPGSLDWAGRVLGLGQKTIGGKGIMKRFADAAVPLPGAKETTLTPADVAVAIEAWALYLDYSVQDTELMRDVWKVTRPLDAAEWAEYWVSEKINDRGMLADLDVCRGAMAYREEEAAHVEQECRRLTDGQIAGPTLTKQINEWVFERLPDDLAELMVRERDEEGYVTRLSGAKDVMGRLLEDIHASDSAVADEVVELIELLQFGRASSSIKFEKILNQNVDGRLGGSYVFNGAGQTGRFCLAEDSYIWVRTSNGMVEQRAVQELHPDEQVWDGDQWVAHEGVVYSGRKEVFTYDGVEATSDHKVYTSDTEYATLRDAAERGMRIYEVANPCTQYTK